MALIVKNIAWAKETAWGTPNTTPTAYPRIKNFAPAFDMGTKLVEDTTNTAKGYSKIVNLKKTVEGDITFNAYADDLGNWLQMMFGAASSANHTSETLVKDHTFSQGNTLQSFTMLADKGVEVDEFVGVYGHSLKLNATNDIVEGTLAVNAKDKLTAGSNYTPAVTEIDPFTFDYMNIGFGANITAAKAATPLPVDEWDWTYNLELDRRWQSGSKLASRIDPTIAKFNGSFKQFYLSNTWENNYLNGVEQAIYFNLKNTDITIGTAANYQLQVSGPRVQYKKSDRPYEAGKLVVETVEFEGMYSPTDTYMVQAILTNLNTSYL